MLPDLARKIEDQSSFDTTPTRVAPGLLGSDSTRSEGLGTRFPFRLRNVDTIYEEAIQFESLSAL
jgi:hypothetical protein